MNRIREWRQRLSLDVSVSLRHFAVTLGTAVLCFIGMALAGRVSRAIQESAPIVHLLLFSIVSLCLSSVFSVFFIHKPLRPVSRLLDALTQIAKGDYSVRLNLRGGRVIKDLNNSFNHMAKELGSVEMLRTDFVNNFSHEFKTPIVSISGFARMLKRDTLTEAERAEYLDIIISESDRLSALAANVLSLAKIENQHILTGETDVNISEQLRQTVVLLEKKWTAKQLDIHFDAAEVMLRGNEDLLMQVWLNLLDNAIKFSPDGGAVQIELKQRLNEITVSVINEDTISEAAMAHIFDKFYQGDTAHAAQGNGLGLTIAQKITELHGGTLRAASTGDGCIIFLARFPQAE